MMNEAAEMMIKAVELANSGASLLTTIAIGVLTAFSAMEKRPSTVTRLAYALLCLSAACGFFVTARLVGTLTQSATLAFALPDARDRAELRETVWAFSPNDPVVRLTMFIQFALLLAGLLVAVWSHSRRQAPQPMDETPSEPAAAAGAAASDPQPARVSYAHGPLPRAPLPARPTGQRTAPRRPRPRSRPARLMLRRRMSA